MLRLWPTSWAEREREHKLGPRANPRAVLTAGHPCPDLCHGAPGSPTGRKNVAVAPASAASLDFRTAAPFPAG